MTLDPSDTIAAIASPSGPGLRGIVRVSGPEAWEIALEGFEGDEKTKPPAGAHRRVGRLRVDGLRRPLQVALALWPGSKTYTGQPLAELHTPGSPPLLRAILTHCLTRGSRLAEAGESLMPPVTLNDAVEELPSASVTVTTSVVPPVGPAV